MSYYMIISQLNGFALDVEGNNPNPGTKVFPWPKHGNANQLFYDDPATGTIRTKLNNFCLDIENNQLVTKPFQQGDPNQQWERRGNVIANRINPNEVLDIAGSDKNQGARVTKYQSNGGQNQTWNFEYVGGQPAPQGQYGYPQGQQGGYPQGQQGGYPQGQQGGYPNIGASTYPAYPAYPSGGQQTSYPPAPSQQPQPPQRQEFYIVSEMNGKVVDIKGGSKDAGADIIMWSKNPQKSKNQRWYLDDRGHIRSALNDMVFAAKSGDYVKMARHSGEPHSQWKFDGNKVVNQSGDVLDICRGNKGDGATLCAYKPHGKENQRFKREVD